ncbi:MAG: heat-inducible transcriptional repressor HrcA [Chloroflexota bacterium]
MKAGSIIHDSGKRELSERERAILNKIVQLYILKASPIGSRFLSKVIQEEMNLSAATLRNVMSDLEELDYISHPHTSAGRIPTDKGYRFYVNSISSPEQLGPGELTKIKKALRAAEREALLKDASRLLGAVSRCLGVVRAPQLNEAIIRKIEIVPLSSDKLLIILALDSDIIRSVTLETGFDTREGDIEQLKSYVNEKISGRPLKFLKANFPDIMTGYSHREAPLVRLFADSLGKLFEFTYSPERVILAGAQDLVSNPEFEDINRIRGVIELVENEDVIVHMLDQIEEREAQGVQIFIGREMENSLLDDYSLITTSYKIGGAAGSIGVIGPKRMNYPKMISVVKLVADFLSKNENSKG